MRLANLDINNEKFWIGRCPQLRLLNPGEASGADKDPDDPWDLAHPRCRGEDETIHLNFDL
jgi:hypothetical protein